MQKWKFSFSFFIAKRRNYKLQFTSDKLQVRNCNKKKLQETFQS